MGQSSSFRGPTLINKIVDTLRCELCHSKQLIICSVPTLTWEPCCQAELKNNLSKY